MSLDQLPPFIASGLIPDRVDPTHGTVARPVLMRDRIRCDRTRDDQRHQRHDGARLHQSTSMVQCEPVVNT
jgi:hypothetical protein